MSSGDDCTGTARPACPSAGHVPVGWERKVEEGSVCYISPSGTTLTSLEQTCAYLLADGTCKCGLECPLNMYKVFNFDPGAAVAERGAPGAQGQQDMTKLCNHRWKTTTMATVYCSTEGTPGPCCPGTGLGLSPLFSAEGHLAMAPSTGIPPPSTVGSFPMVPLGAKTLEATTTPTGTWLITLPFLQSHDIIPRANSSPKSHPPASPCFGLHLSPPDAATLPRSPEEQALALGDSLLPGLLLGTLPFSVALGQHPPACRRDPEGPSLPSLLAASLLPLPMLPLSIPLPTLDLLPSPRTLLSTLLPLLPGPGERGPEVPTPSPEGCLVLPNFFVLPASFTFHPKLLTAALGPPKPAPTFSASSLPSRSVACTSTDTRPMTTEALCRQGRTCGSPTGTLEHLNLLGCHLGKSLLGAAVLGNLPALSPLLQNQPLLPPTLPCLGLLVGPGLGSPMGTASPLAGLLQSLQ
ncbi:PREDICTED: methyl-CpG-binding domain protein 6, partial [Cariama cristata]|uniref:methyl-CpG-binding domain protein 6 n=1 Tax=Cariama cristata TaxID=54380 RepID=UPI0005203674